MSLNAHLEHAFQRMGGGLLSADELAAIVRTTVTDSVWLVGRGQPELARGMRDAFMHEWEIEQGWWNEAVDEMIDFVARKGDTPETSIRQLQAVRIGTVMSDED